MTTSALRFASAGLLMPLLLAAGLARAEDGASRAGSDPCGRAASLEAAKEALARGERAEALEHLRRAEERLERCDPPRDTAPSDEPAERAEPALAFGAKTSLPRLPS